VTARSNILGLEIAVNDRQIEAVANIPGLRARRGVLACLGRASKATLDRAGRRTTIAVYQVSVIAGFAWIEVAVAAGRGASLGLAATVLTIRLLRAGFRAALAVAVEQAVHGLATAWQIGWIRAAIAQFGLFENPVAALRHLTRLSRRWTVRARFELARAGTAVAADGIAIVADLSTR
jgi:hypothetical protein